MSIPILHLKLTELITLLVTRCHMPIIHASDYLCHMIPLANAVSSAFLCIGHSSIV